MIFAIFGDKTQTLAIYPETWHIGVMEFDAQLQLESKMFKNPISHYRGNMIFEIVEGKTHILPEATQLGDMEFTANYSLNTKVFQNPISHARGNITLESLEDKTHMLPEATQIGLAEFDVDLRFSGQTVAKYVFPHQRIYDIFQFWEIKCRC